MLDPTRYALNAATVGFRKRTGQSVDWGAFHNAIQNQTDAIKVRREKQETLVSELHVMGGQRFGMEGNGKSNELARQQRQMNGYPLRSFIATGGAIVLPPKHGEGLLAIPMNLGLNQYTQYNAVVGNYVSRFVEPLNAPLENNTILLGKAGIRAQNESASDPYKTMQFNNNMHKNLEEIRANQQKHLELRGFKRQGSEKDNINGLSDRARLLAEEQTRAYAKRRKRQEDAEGQSLPQSLPLKRHEAISKVLGRLDPSQNFVGPQEEDNVMTEEEQSEYQNASSAPSSANSRSASPTFSAYSRSASPTLSPPSARGVRPKDPEDDQLWDYVQQLPVQAQLHIMDTFEEGKYSIGDVITDFRNTRPEWFIKLDREIQTTANAKYQEEYEKEKIAAYNESWALREAEYEEEDRLFRESQAANLPSRENMAAIATQRVINNHILDSDGGSLLQVEEVFLNYAIRDEAAIGKSQNGLERTPIRNSAPSGGLRAKGEIYGDTSTLYSSESTPESTPQSTPSNLRNLSSPEFKLDLKQKVVSRKERRNKMAAEKENVGGSTYTPPSKRKKVMSGQSRGQMPLKAKAPPKG